MEYFLEIVTVTFTRQGKYVYVYAVCRIVLYEVPEDAFVSFDGRIVLPLIWKCV